MRHDVFYRILTNSTVDTNYNTDTDILIKLLLKLTLNIKEVSEEPSRIFNKYINQKLNEETLKSITKEDINEIDGCISTTKYKVQRALELLKEYIVDNQIKFREPNAPVGTIIVHICRLLEFDTTITEEIFINYITELQKEKLYDK